VTTVRVTCAAVAVAVVAACNVDADRPAPAPPAASPSSPAAYNDEAPSSPEVRYLRRLLDDIHDRGRHDAVRDALAAAPSTLPPAVLLRLEDDLLTLADQVHGNAVEDLTVEPADGLAPGTPIRVQLTDGSALRVRVACDGGVPARCRVVGVER
jgi:hypothetical protein